MAHGNIGDVPASLYAEYAAPASLELRDDVDDGASGASSEEASEVVDELDAPLSTAFQSAVATRPAMRPALVHRLHSNNLHVRAKANAQRDRLLSGSMIDVLVGEEKRVFRVHRNLLCHQSEQLQSELEGDGKKRPDKLELGQYDPKGFELMVKWLYQGKLDDVSEFADPNQKYEYAVNCYHLWRLADRFGLPQLQNGTISFLTNIYRRRALLRSALE